jgi:hypothetical protein
VFAGAVMLVIAPAFCGGVALAHGPGTDTVAASHHAAVTNHRVPRSVMKGVANTDRAPPPVVVQLSKAELSRGPAQGSGPVSLPMSFGQPVAPEDELAATPAPSPASTRRRGASLASRQATHLATFSVPVTTKGGVAIPN